MPSLLDLHDDFDFYDPAIWDASYGQSVVDSRGRLVTTAGGFCGFKTGQEYSLPDGAGITVRVYVDPKLSATVTCYTGLWIMPSSPAGTHFGIVVDRMVGGNGTLYVENRVSYSDGARTSVSFSDSTMAWWRIRRSGSNILMDTAPEVSPGLPGTWTNRRTFTAPAWATTDTDLCVLFEAYRNDGGPGYSEMDFFNTSAPAQNQSAFFQFF
jgi:hypothetical protein